MSLADSIKSIPPSFIEAPSFASESLACYDLTPKTDQHISQFTQLKEMGSWQQ